MTEYHEPWESLPEEVRNLHRALKSVQEELEAVDWYHQRATLCQDEALRAVLAHNRDEEIEHACMTLEWLRRRMPGWDENLRTYLFTQDPITKVEEKAEKDGEAGKGEVPALQDLGIGALKPVPGRKNGAVPVRQGGE